MNGAEKPASYDADEAGAQLGKSGDWMKKQARAGKIVFTRVGQSMRWTDDHIREILRAGEQRPQAALVSRTPARKRSAEAAAPVLRAKTPPRKRSAA
jgi:beta-galactosidase/beta-glucuronidase